MQRPLSSLLLSMNGGDTVTLKSNGTRADGSRFSP